MHLELRNALECLVAMEASLNDFRCRLWSALLQLGFRLVATSPFTSDFLYLRLVILVVDLFNLAHKWKICVRRCVAFRIEESDSEILTKPHVAALALLLEVVGQGQSVVAVIADPNRKVRITFIDLQV